MKNDNDHAWSESEIRKELGRTIEMNKPLITEIVRVVRDCNLRSLRATFGIDFGFDADRPYILIAMSADPVIQDAVRRNVTPKLPAHWALEFSEPVAS